jgi:hypothetical protein
MSRRDETVLWRRKWVFPGMKTMFARVEGVLSTVVNLVMEGRTRVMEGRSPCYGASRVFFWPEAVFARVETRYASVGARFS